MTALGKVVFPPDSHSRVADVWRGERAGVGSPALIGRFRWVSTLIGCSSSSWRGPVRREFQFQIFWAHFGSIGEISFLIRMV